MSIKLKTFFIFILVIIFSPEAISNAVFQLDHCNFNLLTHDSSGNLLLFTKKDGKFGGLGAPYHETIYVFDIKKKKYLLSKSINFIPNKLAISNDNKYIAFYEENVIRRQTIPFLSLKQIIRVLNLETMEFEKNIYETEYPLEKNSYKLKMLFNPKNNSELLFFYRNKIILLKNIYKKQIVEYFNIKSIKITDIISYLNSDNLLIQDDKNNIFIFNTNKKTIVKNLIKSTNSEENKIIDLFYNSIQNTLSILNNNDDIYIWDLSKLKVKKHFKAYRDMNISFLDRSNYPFSEKYDPQNRNNIKVLENNLRKKFNDLNIDSIVFDTNKDNLVINYKIEKIKNDKIPFSYSKIKIFNLKENKDILTLECKK